MPDRLIRSFDHSDVASLPEYAAASKALDDLAHAVERTDGVSRDRFVEAVREMAVALPYGDATQCEHPGIIPPYKATVDQGWIDGRYRCSECGTEWKCGHGTGYIDTAG